AKGRRMAVLRSEASPFGLFESAVGDRTNSERLQTLGRISHAASGMSEIAWILIPSADVLCNAKPGSGSTAFEITGALNNEHVIIVAKQVKLGCPCRHVAQPARGVGIYR